MFRVTINPEGTNRNAEKLGDRVLSAWVGTADNGIIHMPTYTYTNLNGDGNPNLVKNINHNNKILQWHFVYMGYSRDDK